MKKVPEPEALGLGKRERRSQPLIFCGSTEGYTVPTEFTAYFN